MASQNAPQGPYDEELIPRPHKDEHVSMRDYTEMELEDKFDRLEAQIAALLRSQEKTDAQLQDFIEKASGLMKAYETAESAITLGVNIQKMLGWVAKWPLIGAGLYTIWEFIKTKNGA